MQNRIGGDDNALIVRLKIKKIQDGTAAVCRQCSNFFLVKQKISSISLSRHQRIVKV